MNKDKWPSRCLLDKQDCISRVIFKFCTTFSVLKYEQPQKFKAPIAFPTSAATQSGKTGGGAAIRAGAAIRRYMVDVEIAGTYYFTSEFHIYDT